MNKGEDFDTLLAEVGKAIEAELTEKAARCKEYEECQARHGIWTPYPPTPFVEQIARQNRRMLYYLLKDRQSI